jgi:hypothetical protein
VQARREGGGRGEGYGLTLESGDDCNARIHLSHRTVKDIPRSRLTIIVHLSTPAVYDTFQTTQRLKDAPLQQYPKSGRRVSYGISRRLPEGAPVLSDSIMDQRRL